MLTRSFSSLAGILVAVLLLIVALSTTIMLLSSSQGVEAAAFGSYDIGPCLQQCCCQVCSSRASQAWPYGLLNQPLSGNPTNPSVIGSTCHVSVWSDQGQVNDTNGNLVTAPDTLLWTDANVFGDTAAHQAPMSCSCCQLSVDTSCGEDLPVATPPKTFRYVGGEAIEAAAHVLDLVQGVQLTIGDIIELRNNTWCGYNSPGYTLQSAAGGDMTVAADGFSVAWNIPTMPAAGCYRLCYYHSNLTTPGWYHVGDVVVNAAPAGSITAATDSNDVPLEGNDVTLTFQGLGLLSPFDDTAEIRSAGNCGDPGPQATTAQPNLYGSLDVLSDVTWCSPAIARRYTSIRPVQLITPVYADCPVTDRIYQEKMQWKLTLPVAGTYTVCYNRGGSWNTLAGTLTVAAQNTASVALLALHTATNGASWKFDLNWGIAADVCTWYGVRCNSNSEVTGLFLSNNNLVGNLPVAFFQAAFFNTIEDLKLDQNDITNAQLPDEIGLFRKLKHLDLGYNANLAGTLPQTLLKTSLQIIYVSNTQLTGDIPYPINQIGQQWFNRTSLFQPAVPFTTPACPTFNLICSDKGSTDVGVAQCGNSGITEAECLVMGCCYNIQAPLTFGGTACFTKKPLEAAQFPQCTATSCNMVVV